MSGRGARRGWRALRYHNFRLYFAGLFVSMSGAWMLHVAQGWLVLELTGDPFMLGLLAAAQFGPIAAFGLVGGYLADHHSKRAIIAVTQAVQLGLAGGLFVLTAWGHVQVWQVVVIAVAHGFTQAVGLPTRQSISAELVDRDELINANGLNATTNNVGRVVGSAAAGLMIGFAGMSLAFLVAALAYLPLIFCMLAIRQHELVRAPATARPSTLAGIWRGLAGGPRFVAREPAVRTTMAVLGVVATFGMNFTVLAPPLARDVLGVDATGFGTMMAASGAGSLAVAVLAVFVRRIDPRMIALASALLGLANLGLAVSRSFPVSVALMAVAGAGSIGIALTGTTFIQLSVPDALRGRVISVWTMVFSASVPLGGILLGAVAAQVGVAVAVGVGGGVSAGTALVAFAWYQRFLAGQRARRAAPELLEVTAGGPS